jgi:hypothetical protein
MRVAASGRSRSRRLQLSRPLSSEEQNSRPCKKNNPAVAAHRRTIRAARVLFVSPLCQRSLMAEDTVCTSGENRYSRMRLFPVLTSTEAAMPGRSGIGTPSMSMVFLARASVIGKTRFWVRWAPPK